MNTLDTKEQREAFIKDFMHSETYRQLPNAYVRFNALLDHVKTVFTEPEHVMDAVKLMLANEVRH